VNMLKHAQAYAKKGWLVFPLHYQVEGECSCGDKDCDNPAKHPRTPHGYLDATTDPDTITGWWTNWPDANIGVATGAVSGIVVVDTDLKNDGPRTWSDLQDIHGPVDTLSVLTGGGGNHWIFRAPTNGHLKGTAGKIGVGIGTRAEGGYIVAPPSVHVSGDRYEWDHRAEIAPVPDWVLDLWEDQGTGHGAQFVDAEIDVIPDGQRNDTLFRIASTMRRQNLSESAIVTGLGAIPCETLMTEDEIRKIASSAGRYTPVETPMANAPQLKITTMKNIQARRTRWLWPGKFPQGKLTVIAGDPGLGKSFLTLDVAARVSVGGLWPDGGTAPIGDVLLITAEDGLDDTVRPRLDLLGADVSRIHSIEITVDNDGESVALSLTDHLQQIEDAIVVYKVILLVIDPILALTGKKDTHKSGDVRSVLAPLSAMADRTSCAVVAIMHLNKNSKEGNALYRVTSSLDFVAAARSALIVGEHPEDPDKRVLVSIKANLSAKPASLGFHIDDRGCFIWDGIVDLDAHGVLNMPMPEEKAARIEAKEFLAETLNDGPRPAKDVQTEARQYGISDSTLKRAATELDIQKNRVGGIGKSGYWRWSLSKEGPSTTSDLLSGNGLLSSHPTPAIATTKQQGDLLSGGVERHRDILSKNLATKEVTPNGQLGSNTTKEVTKGDVEDDGFLRTGGATDGSVRF